jgi:hypothetical protein
MTTSPRKPWLLIACLATVLLRAPSFRFGVISDDEAIYSAMAQELHAGGVMYRDTVDHKPPGLAYTYATADSIARGDVARGMNVVHAIGLLAALGSCLAIDGIARVVLAPELAGVAALLYAVTSAAKIPVDGLAVNGELLMNLPATLALLVALIATRRRARSRIGLDLLAGVLIGAATLFKYQAALVGVALLPLAWQARPWRGLSRAVAWSLGFGATSAATAWAFEHARSLDAMIRWGLDFNRHYLGDAPPLADAMKRLAGQLAIVVVPGAIVWCFGLMTLSRLLRRRDDAGDVHPSHASFLIFWTLPALAAVTLGGRFFGHYFLQPEPALAILAAGPASRLFARRPFTIALLVVPATLYAIVATIGDPPGKWLDPGAPDLRAIGRAIADRTRADETIWVWGNAPQIYFEARRRPGVRFTFCNYLTGLSPATPSEHDPSVDPEANAVASAWPDVIADLDAHAPTIVVDTATAALKSYGKFPVARYPVLARYLADHYRVDAIVDGATLYRRRDR